LTYLEADLSEQEKFLLNIKQLKDEDIVFLDESAFEENPRDYARSLKGEKIRDKISGKKKKKQNIISALCNKKMLAPFVFEGRMNTDLFTGWLEQCLVPELIINQTVIMDNAPWHISEEVRNIIEDAGCKLLYLPKYSPELNKIEHYWGAMKKFIKSFWRKALSFSKKVDLTVQKYAL
jgi:transposase